MLRATDLPEPVVPAIKQMRHLREVGHHRFAADRLAQRQDQRRARLFVIARAQKLAQINRFAIVIGKLDAHHVAAGDDGDTRGHRAHRTRDVVGQADHARRLHARGRLEFVKRDDGTRTHGYDATAHAEIAEHGFQHARVFFQRFVGECGCFVLLDGLGQKPQRRQLIFALAQIERGLPGTFRFRRRAPGLFAFDAAGATGGDRLGCYVEAVIVLVFFLVTLFVLFLVALFFVFVFFRFVLFVFVMRGEEFRHADEGADMADRARYCGDGAPECADAHARCDEGECQTRDER